MFYAGTVKAVVLARRIKKNPNARKFRAVACYPCCAAPSVSGLLDLLSKYSASNHAADMRRMLNQ